MNTNFYIISVVIIMILSIAVAYQIYKDKKENPICRYKKTIMLCWGLVVLVAILNIVFIVNMIVNKDITLIRDVCRATAVLLACLSAVAMLYHQNKK